MPTRQGWNLVIGGIAALVAGRVFGVVELYIIGVGLLLATLVAVIVVQVFRPRLEVKRWVHPTVLTVGTAGRVDLIVQQPSARRSPRVTLGDPVGDHNTAFMSIGSLGRGEQVTAGYRLPATQRGVLLLGPATVERRDLLGLASTWNVVSSATQVTIAPRTLELPMPSLGQGVLGRHLLALSQRLGPGEFHSLRDYVAGDEPRSIHWKASARSLDLKVRSHEAQGVRRCIVVLDTEHLAYANADKDAFERAIVAAASIVVSADRVGLGTRLVTGGADLRGPDVAMMTLQTLARLNLGGPVGPIERDPGEGLGIQVIVTAGPDAPLWQERSSATDPTLTRLAVFAAAPASQAGAHAVSQSTSRSLSIPATTLDIFRHSWGELVASRGSVEPPASRSTSPVGART